MPLPDKSEWVRAFMEQAELDLDFATGLSGLIDAGERCEWLRRRPELYCPTVYAYCQQAIEKALKAWLWHKNNSIPRRHNPMAAVLKHVEAMGPKHPEHLDIVDAHRDMLDQVLNMAPGAACQGATMEILLRQPNTEYPFAVSSTRVKLPREEISELDVASALKIASPLVVSIKKYLAAQGLYYST